MRWVPVLMVALVVLPPFVPAGTADTADALPTALPSSRMGTSAVWAGDFAYVFGGNHEPGNVRLNEILRFDPITGESIVVGTLPTPTYYTEAVWTGQRAYVIGGSVPGFVTLDTIVEFDPTAGTASVVAHLPGGRYGTSAVWTGEYVYVFGGWTGGVSCCNLDQIVRFDPATKEVIPLDPTVPGQKLPSPRHGMAAVWIGEHAYIFGGFGGSAGSGTSSLRAEVLQFDAATETITTVACALPTPRAQMGAVWTEKHGYLLGGDDVGTDYLDEILRFDPATCGFTSMGAHLPAGRGIAGTVWTGGLACMFGGYDGAATQSEIVCYDPLPGAPTNVAAVSGPGVGDVTVSWDPPAAAHDEQLVAYRIYRDGTPVPVEVPASQSSYTDGGHLSPLDTPVYDLSAVNAEGEGPRSAAACARPYPWNLVFGALAMADCP